MVEQHHLSNRHSADSSSFYSRMSIHYFHITKDRTCCCCIPVGMAFHIIAILDVLMLIAEIINIVECAGIINYYH